VAHVHDMSDYALVNEVGREAGPEIAQKVRERLNELVGQSTSSVLVEQFEELRRKIDGMADTVGEHLRSLGDRIGDDMGQTREVLAQLRVVIETSQTLLTECRRVLDESNRLRDGELTLARQREAREALAQESREERAAKELEARLAFWSALTKATMPGVGVFALALAYWVAKALNVLEWIPG